MKARVILHIDFDSFFASVEQQYNSAFRNKPLGVTATNGRTCIIASSREAKLLGITTGTPTYKAEGICPSINLTPADFVKYWEVSKKFITICKDYSPLVEVFSIDELFMDITQTAYLFGGVHPLIQRLKQRIKEEIGEYITASIGISYNKLLSKLGSGLKKPNGVITIDSHDVDRVYASARLTDICGIGERIKARLNMMGIFTLLQLRKVSLSYLIAEFGTVEGKFLKNVGLGVDMRDVIPYTADIPVKSVSRQYCLPENEYDERAVLQNIYELCEEIGIKLRKLHKKAKRIGISVVGNTYSGGYLTNNEFIHSGQDLFKTCLAILSTDMLESAIGNYTKQPVHLSGFITIRQLAKSTGYFRKTKVDTYSFLQKWRKDHDESWYTRRISVWAGNLEQTDLIPRSLFFDNQKNEKLVRVIDKLNETFGDHTIRNGFLLKAAKLTTVPNGWMADKVERIKLQHAKL